MMRWIWIFIKLGIIAALAVWFADHPGYVHIEWQGYVVTTPHVGLLLAIVAALMLFWGWIWHFLVEMRDFPAAFMRGRAIKRRERGYRALSYGMVAVAAGDAEAAGRLAKEAEILLEEPPLTMLLSAQAAQLNGDEDAAARYFRAMETRPETAFLGIRGQLVQALKTHDDGEALLLARRAYAEQPDSDWVARTLLTLELKNRAWDRALEAMSIAAGKALFDEKTSKRIRSAIHVMKARNADNSKDKLKALKTAIKLDPGFTPAGKAMAQLQMERGKTRSAVYHLRKSWAAAPHPELAQLWAQVKEDETPLKRVKWMKKLADINPADGVADMAIGKAAMEAQLWGEARQRLEDALKATRHRALYALLAELADKDSDIATRQEAENWRHQMETAPPPPAWHCSDCGYKNLAWEIFCPHCDHLCSLQWGMAEDKNNEDSPPLLTELDEAATMLDAIAGPGR